MNKATIPFDISEYLDSEDMIAEYLSAVMEENDLDLLLNAIGAIAKARGMSKIATDSGLGRESLYKALTRNSHPRFDTIVKVLNAMDIKISFTATNNKVNAKEIRKRPKSQKSLA